MMNLVVVVDLDSLDSPEEAAVGLDSPGDNGQSEAVEDDHHHREVEEESNRFFVIMRMNVSTK